MRDGLLAVFPHIPGIVFGSRFGWALFSLVPCATEPCASGVVAGQCCGALCRVSASGCETTLLARSRRGR